MISPAWARSTFLAEGLRLDAADVGLDLAVLLVDQGDNKRVVKLLEDTYLTFLEEGLERHALAVRILLIAALERTLGRLLAEEVSQLVRRIGREEAAV